MGATKNYALSMPLYLPKHGVKVTGKVTIGSEASSAIRLGTTSGTPSTTGPLDFFAKNLSSLASVGKKAFANFNNITASANGKIWSIPAVTTAITSTSTAIITISGFEDVV